MKLKRLLSLILAVILTFTLAACNNGKKADEGNGLKEAVGVTIPAFSLDVNGTQVTDKDLAEYPVYEVSAVSTNSAGTDSTNVYIGFSLKDVLDVAKAGEFKTLKAIASDGYEVEVPAEEALKPDTLIAISRDGEQMKDGPWFAPCSNKTTGNYNKGVVAIALDNATVNAGGEAAPAATPADGTLPEMMDKTDKVQFGEFHFRVNGQDVSNANFEGLKIYKVDVNTVNKDGETQTATYTGYKLKDVMQALWISGATKVVVVANDGYTTELSPEYVNSDYTLVAIEKDKETGENGTVWIAPCQSTSAKDYSKLVVEFFTA